MTFEYIASGLSYVYKTSFDMKSNPKLCTTMQHSVKQLCKYFPKQRFGTLFNGFYEKRVGPVQYEIFNEWPIHCDSGGLQMITLGKGITEAGKDEVYKTQAKYSTHGYSFDEIPVVVHGQKTNTFDLKIKSYHPQKLEECAIQSGKNLKRQIEVYLEEKTSCRPMLIVQGSCLEDYQRWADLMLKEIPAEYYQYIVGISSGSGALGNGFREDVERVFVLTQLDVPKSMKKQFHLLGFGSANRLIPAVQFRRSGLLDKNIVISYDSTKHTGNVVRGQYQEGVKLVRLSRSKDGAFHKAFEKISKLCKYEFDIEFTEEDFYDTMIALGPEWFKKYGDRKAREYERNIVPWAFFMYSVHNTMESIEKMEADEHYIETFKDSETPAYLALTKIRDVKDFGEWKRHVSRMVQSRRVKHAHEVNQLNNFFGE